MWNVKGQEFSTAMYSLMKAYLSRVSIPSVFGERQRPIPKRRRPLIFVDRRWRRRTYVRTLSTLFTAYISRVPVEIRFTSVVPRGNYEKYRRQSGTIVRRGVPIAVNKSGETKSDICTENEARAQSRFHLPRRIEIISRWIRIVLQ